MNRGIRLLLATSALVVLIWGSALPAQAHARLLATEPSAGALLQEPPTQVALRFDEPMELAFGSIAVFDGDGTRRDVGGVRHLTGDRTAVAVPVEDLGAGGYAVSWQITSADGHPLEGSFTFRVDSGASMAPELTGSIPSAGAILEQAPRDIALRFDRPIDTARIEIFDRAGEQVAGGEANVLSSPPRAGLRISQELAPGGYVLAWAAGEGSQTANGAFTFRVAGPEEGGSVERLVVPLGGSVAVGIVRALTQWVIFASLMLLVGGLVFFVWHWNEALARPGTRRYLWSLIVVSGLATVAGILIQGPYSSRRSLSAALDPESATQILSTRVGQAGVARLAVLVAIAVLLVLITRVSRAASRRSPASTVASVVLGVAVLATVSAGGHAGSGDLVPLALVSDAVHLSAGALWLGGLAVMWTWVLRQSEAGAAAVAARFSRTAAWCVGVLIVTGSFASWRQVGSLNAALGTDYGRLLLVKLGFFGVLVGLAALSRVRLRRAWPSDPGQAPGVRALRKLVGAETALAVMVLAVTALLVGSIPARDAESRPFAVELVAGDVGRSAEIIVDPARAGVVDIHIYTFDLATGAVAAIDSVSGQFSKEGVGTLEVPFEPAGPGHFSAYGFDVPIPGEWVLEIDGELGGEEFNLSTTVEFR